MILGEDRETERRRLVSELEIAARKSGGARLQVKISQDPTVLNRVGPGDPTTAVVFLGGPTAAASEALRQAADKCLQHFIPTLPVFDPTLGTLQSQLPESLLGLNAVKWVQDASASVLAGKTLRLLGITERDRRIFISYRQTDAAGLADQLRKTLIDVGWDVFLDRFSIPPGVDFQQRLDRELAEKSFVLLLETPTAADSPWVEHEIAFAQQRRLGMMALTLPDTRPAELYPAIEPSSRYQLDDTDVTGSAPEYVLASTSLERIVDEIEQRHAAAYSLRRESAMLEAGDELRRCGYEIKALGEWALIAEKADQREIVFVTVRSPEASDLRIAHQLRESQRPHRTPTRGWIVHPTEDIDSDRSSLIHWLSRNRKVAATPVMLLAGRVR
ncbi:toll/interleukin-1 receptor domain-containing protein [Salinibacterium sp. PAMC 21357]|uniref:toll/interleukin-1 receptor domain-containing protein n=1 Tax=Salinibacterium sp. PAMC 21357 TaxID=1112215 RepID=UPI001300BFDC|nr:toll/interleukin-1 receptor domain-containing protein [Salinibacterium sp. PAMC 21357]